MENMNKKGGVHVQKWTRFFYFPFRGVEPFEPECCDLFLPAELVHAVKNIPVPAPRQHWAAEYGSGGAADLKNCHHLYSHASLTVRKGTGWC